MKTRIPQLAHLSNFKEALINSIRTGNENSIFVSLANSTTYGGTSLCRRIRGSSNVALIYFIRIMRNLYPRTQVIFATIVGTVLAIFYFDFTVQNEIAGIYDDEIVYLFLADAFRSVYTAPITLVEYQRQNSSFPPLYPMVLSLLGGGSDDLALSHVITTSILLFSFVVFFLWVLRETNNFSAALFLCLIYSILPITLLLSLVNLSEPLFLFLTLFALLLNYYAERDTRLDYAVALIAGLAACTRTIGIAFVAAFLVLHCLKKIRHWREKELNAQSTRMDEGPFKLVLLVLVSLLPLVAWNLYLVFTGTGSSYIEDLFFLHRHNPIDQILSVMSTALWKGWLRSFDSNPLDSMTIIITLLGLICLFGALVRSTRNRLDGIYTTFYLVILFLWPYPDQSQRFLFPIIPIMLFQGYWLFIQSTKYIPLRLKNVYPYTLFLGISFIILPTTFFMIQRFYADVGGQLKPFRHTNLWVTSLAKEVVPKGLPNLVIAINAMKKAKNFVPENDCIYSVLHQMTMFYSQRVSYRISPLTLNSKDFLRRSGYCKWYLVTQVSRPGVPALFPANFIKQKATVVFNLTTNHSSQTSAALLKLEN